MDYMEYDFDLADEPRDEQLEEEIERNTKAFKLLNPARLKDAKNALVCLKNCIGGRVECRFEQVETTSSAACIILTSKEFIVRDPRLFLKAVKLADNYEIYSRTDGLVQINITFYNSSILGKVESDND